MFERESEIRKEFDSTYYISPDGAISIEFSGDIYLWLGYESTMSNETKISEVGWRNFKREVEILQRRLPEKSMYGITALARKAGGAFERYVTAKR